MPPSPPSTVTKSTPRSPRAISRVSSCQKLISPTALLMPTGTPVSSATSSTKSSRLSSSVKAVCRDGLAQSLPIGMPRISLISLVTLAAGSRPPSPGLAPWESLISIARTGADSTTSLSLLEREPSVLVAAAEVRRTDLQHDVAALAVVRREPALTGVVHAAGRASRPC